MVLYLYVLSDENLLNNVLLIKEEATKAMVTSTTSLALARNWTTVTEFASHTE